MNNQNNKNNKVFLVVANLYVGSIGNLPGYTYDEETTLLDICPTKEEAHERLVDIVKFYKEKNKRIIQSCKIYIRQVSTNSKNYYNSEKDFCDQGMIASYNFIEKCPDVIEFIEIDNKDLFCWKK